jgi:hypothetical protein
MQPIATRFLTNVLVLVCTALMNACGGDDTNEPPAPTFTELYDELLFPNCAGGICHGGGAGSLDLSTRDAAYGALVSVAAMGPQCGSSGARRVVPGDPDASLMYQKLLPNPPCGARMPGVGALTDDDIERIGAWIEDGAQND